MSIFKLMILSLCLSVPVVAGAVSTSVHLTDSVASSLYSGDLNQQVFYDTAGTMISDDWTINLLSGESALVSFTFSDYSPFISVDDFKVNGILGDYVSLITTTSSFHISGLVDGGFGGGYKGIVTAVSAVPVPAAVWFMGSAMVGLFSFRKRKMALAA